MTWLGAVAWACALGARLVLVAATACGVVACGVIAARDVRRRIRR